MSCKTFEDVFNSEQPTISELSELSTNKCVKAWTIVSAAIISYLNFINRRELMSDLQIAETAKLICEEYGWLKLDDLALFTRMAKTNKFGPLYSIDGQVLFGWIEEYSKMRRDSYNMYLIAKEERDKKIKSLPSPELSQDKINSNFERLERILKNVAMTKSTTRKRKTSEETVQEKVSKLRLQVINANVHLYKQDPEHAIDIINGLVFNALCEAGLPTDSVTNQ